MSKKILFEGGVKNNGRETLLVYSKSVRWALKDRLSIN